MTSPRWLSLKIALLAAAYVVTAKFGFTMAFAAEQVTLVWAPTGLALASLLTFGFRIWPGVFVGAFVANITTNEPLLVALSIATGNTLEAVVATWLLHRYVGFGDSIDRLRHALGLVVLGALISTAISATIGVTSLCLGGVQPWRAYGVLWETWWLGDATGALLVAPMLLTLGNWPRLWRDIRPAETALLLIGLVSASAGVFGGRLRASDLHYPLEYTVFPFLIWAAVRSGVAGAAIANILASGIAVWCTVHGFGPYAAGDVGEHLMQLQAFTCIASATGLLLGAAISERNASARRRHAEYSITHVLADATSADAATRNILMVVSEDLDWDVGLYWHVDRSAGLLGCADFWRQSAGGFPEFERISRTRTFETGIGLPGRVWERGTPQWIVDVQEDCNFPRLQAAAAEGLHGGFAFPVKAAGEIVGVFEFFARSIRQPDPDLLQMFTAIGAEVGQFFTRKAVEQRIQESEARKAGMLEAALDCIITIDRQGRIIEFNAAAERTFGYQRDEVLGLEMADAIIPADLRDEHRRGLARYLETGTAHLIGRRLETVAVRADGSEFPVEVSISRVMSGGEIVFTEFLRDITEQKRMVMQLAFRASHDELTESVNRAAFMQLLNEAVRRANAGAGEAIAVFFVDIDAFKALNDSLGHLVGDRLLATVARRLRAAVRPSDTVGRMGGDEFAILLEQVTSDADVLVVADRIRNAFDEPFNLDGQEVVVTASIGVTRCSVGETAPDDLLREADAAMYRAKASRRGHVADPR